MSTIETIVSATLAGAGLLLAYKHYQRSRREDGLPGDAVSKEIVPQVTAHFFVWPAWAQMREAMADIIGGGIINKVDKPFVTLGSNWGLTHWLYMSVQLPIQWLVVGAWARRSPTLGAIAPWAAILWGLTMTAFAPFSGYKLDVLLGIGMLYAKPVAAGKPYWKSSGWWLGTAHKALAVAHVCFSLSQPRMLEALRALWQAGVFGASELHGIAAVFTGAGGMGPVWGILHYEIIGLNWWMTGSNIQDWALQTNRLRTSTAVLGFFTNLALALICPSHGCVASVLSVPVALMLLKPTTLMRQDGHDE